MYTSTMEHSNIKSGVLLFQKIAQKLVVKYNFFLYVAANLNLI